MALWGLNAIFIFIVEKIYLSALVFAPVNDDAGTFLSLTEKIRTGSILFKDLHSAYMPLSFYVLASVPADYRVYLGTVFGFMFGQAVLVYLILRHFQIMRALSVFASLSVLLLLAYYEGLFVFTEPFVAFFGLLATYFILKSKNNAWLLGLAGISACLSLLSKQYGLFGLPVFVVYILFNRQKLMWFLVGYAVPLICFGFYFCVIHQVPVVEILSQLRHTGYATHGYMAMGDFGFTNHLMFVLLAVPFVFLVPWTLNRDVLLFLGLCLFLGAALLIRPWGHYFGLIIGYAIILEMLALSASPRFFVFAFIGWSSFQAYYISKIINFDPRIRPYQMAVAQEINQIWPQGTKILLYAAPELMWLGHFDPINNQKPSYWFLSNYSGTEQIQFISQAQHILIDMSDWLYFTHEREKIEREGGKPFFDILAEQHFKRVGIVGNQYELWERL